MSEILNKIDGNDYTLQRMVGGSGGEAEDLTIELGAQDTALSTQQTKISELETALENKIALDLANATSDANATAGDIASGKTAYVNGAKITGTAEGSEPDWSEIGYSSVPQALLDDFAYSKNIYDNWDSSVTNLSQMFYYNNALKYMPLVDTSNVTSMPQMFSNASNLTTIPQLDTSQVNSMYLMCSNCTKLVTVPILNTSNLGNMSGNFNSTFSSCPNLSDESLNNILAMCVGAVKITNPDRMKLRYIGLSQDQATTCQSLSNWDAFVAAGWSTGY